MRNVPISASSWTGTDPKSAPATHLLLSAFLLRGSRGSGALGIATLGVGLGIASLRAEQRPHLRPEQQRRLRQASRQRLRRSVPALPHAADESVTTTASPLAIDGIVTPSGSGRSDRCFDSFISIFERSSSMNSGRSFGRQEISTSAMRCETTPPWLFTPGAAASPLKWIGMWMRIFSVSTTRCRSTCRWRCAPGASADP